MGTRREFVNIDCGHCGKAASMEVVATYSAVDDIEDPFDTYSEGSIYRICSCPSCQKITLLEKYINTRATPSDLGTSVLFPNAERVPSGLPEPIERAYTAANRVRVVDANAYAVLLGRVLEKICSDRNAAGDSLNAKIKNLADRGEIPEKLVAIAHSLRQLRNVGAHADLGELTVLEVPVLDGLCRAILEYVYTGPLLVARAAQHLSQLKAT
jgi:hypothetical protein